MWGLKSIRIAKLSEVLINGRQTFWSFQMRPEISAGFTSVYLACIMICRHHGGIYSWYGPKTRLRKTAFIPTQYFVHVLPLPWQLGVLPISVPLSQVTVVSGIGVYPGSQEKTMTSKWVTGKEALLEPWRGSLGIGQFSEEQARKEFFPELLCR